MIAPNPISSAEAPGTVELLLVDFDDTLVDTSPRFQNARRALFGFLAELGFDPGTVRRVHHEVVDPRMIERHGLGPFRLEPSFRETYRQLCADAGIAPLRDVELRCAELGRAVIGPPPSLDGALDALRALADRFPTILYTQSGDPEYQLACVREAGVLDVLPPDRVRICSRKTPDEFLATLDHYRVAEPARAWMIGNSIRSDVNPALTVGARAILVESRDPWEFDLVEPVSDDYLRAASFPDAAGYLLSRFAAR